MESIGSSIFSFEALLGLLTYLPYFGTLVFAIYIAAYFKKRKQGREASILMLGAILQGLSYLSSHLISFVILPMMSDGYSNIQIYYSFVSLIGSAGHFLFLYGVYLYFKKTLNQQPSKKFGIERDIDSFIDRL